MLNFTRLTLDDIGLIKPFFSYSQSRCCDNTVGGTFMWRDFFETEYAIIHNSMVLKVRHFNGQTAFSTPLGGDVKACLSELTRYCAEESIPLVFCLAAKEDADLVGEFIDFDLLPERDWFDYMYDAEDLRTLTGRRFNGQRNHTNYFKRTFDYAFEPINKKNLSDVYDFYRVFAAQHEKNTRLFIEERNKVFEVLENYDTYGLLGGVLYADGKVAAFAIGEIFRDTLFVHIEKADVAIRGAYPMIVNEFAMHYAGEGIRFINREDDVGDEGLRISKLSYHPCELLEKYTVTVK